ncbi:MAG: restriction endonuclease [Candidatus Edwardsbacteria bacterium]|nr:restriction endonuclease [Candidatus Edwardsbacteria bacterium]MBU1576173.1 restriction endonuclease [Candidatus Edwardsbacteria bacterium]MBU2463583.1 restriction endonuclease [Candidatus Edwardsbacteria bacterium]MBU2593213.1 restriction endonuclease [Candidatus Edwardsbacteria bacterium]
MNPLTSQAESIKSFLELRNEIEKVLSTLSKREESIIRLRFGLNDGVPRTLAEVGIIFNVSASTVRNNEIKALNKLRLLSYRLDKFDNILTNPETKELSNKLDEETEKLFTSDILASIKEITPELIKYLKYNVNSISNMNPETFEKLIAELLSSLGFITKHVGRSYETSADICAIYNIKQTNLPDRCYVEVKRWKDKIGIGVIQTVLGAMVLEREKWGWTGGMIVTVKGMKNIKKIKRSELEYKNIYIKEKEDIYEWLKGYKKCENGLLLNPLIDIRK